MNLSVNQDRMKEIISLTKRILIAKFVGDVSGREAVICEI